MRCFKNWKIALLSLPIIAFVPDCLGPSAASLTSISQNSPAFSKTDPATIYSRNPKDTWNRIFSLMFTRDLKVRMSKDFPNEGPFIGLTGPTTPHAKLLPVSSRLYHQYEEGDRAIDPFYPAF